MYESCAFSHKFSPFAASATMWLSCPWPSFWYFLMAWYNCSQQRNSSCVANPKGISCDVGKAISERLHPDSPERKIPPAIQENGCWTRERAWQVECVLHTADDLNLIHGGRRTDPQESSFGLHVRARTYTHTPHTWQHCIYKRRWMLIPILL